MSAFQALNRRQQQEHEQHNASRDKANKDEAEQRAQFARKEAERYRKQCTPVNSTETSAPANTETATEFKARMLLEMQQMTEENPELQELCDSVTPDSSLDAIRVVYLKAQRAVKMLSSYPMMFLMTTMICNTTENVLSTVDLPFIGRLKLRGLTEHMQQQPNYTQMLRKLALKYGHTSMPVEVQFAVSLVTTAVAVHTMNSLKDKEERQNEDSCSRSSSSEGLAGFSNENFSEHN